MQLTIGERVAIVSVLNVLGTKLDFNGLRLSWKIADKIELTDDDREKSGFKQVEGKGFFKDITLIKEIDLKVEETDFLKSLLGVLDKQKLFEMGNGRGIVTLAEKLGFKGDQKNEE